MFAILFIHLIIYKTQKLYWFDSSYLQQMHNLTFQTGKKQKHNKQEETQDLSTQPH